MRKRGYLADVTEKWIPRANVRKDLYGFIDILCLKDAEIIGVQATSAPNVNARVSKIAGHENVGAVRKAGIRILVHGWSKRGARGKRKMWTLREVDVS
jgi:hypothetical protein